MVGSLFFRLGQTVSDARNFYGAAFMVVLFMSMGTMPQISVVVAQKGVWLKHRDSLLYPCYAHGLVGWRTCGQGTAGQRDSRDAGCGLLGCMLFAACVRGAKPACRSAAT